MPFRNAFDRLTLGRSKGRSQDGEQSACDLAMSSEGPAGNFHALSSIFFSPPTNIDSEPSSTPHLPDPSTPGGPRRRLLPQLVTRPNTENAATPSTRPVARSFSRGELASLSKFPTPRLPTDSPPLRVTPAHMSSRRFRELLDTEPPSAFGLNRESTESAARCPDDKTAAYDASTEPFGMLGSEEGIGLGISFSTTTLPAGTSTSESPIRRHRCGDFPPPMLSRSQYQAGESATRGERSERAEGQRNRDRPPGEEGQRNRDRPRGEHVVAHGDAFFLEGSSEQLESAADNGGPRQHLGQPPSSQPAARVRQQIPKAYRVLGIPENSAKPFQVLGILSPQAQQIRPERALEPPSEDGPERRQHPKRTQIFSSSRPQGDALREQPYFGID